MALKRCTKPFATKINGRSRVVRVGDLVDEADPLYVGRERNFVAVAATAGDRPQVEQATAAPSERRPTRRPSKSRETDIKQEGPSDA